MKVLMVDAARTGKQYENAKCDVRDLKKILRCEAVFANDLPVPQNKNPFHVLMQEAERVDAVLFLPGWWKTRVNRMLFDWCKFMSITVGIACRRKLRWTVAFKGETWPAL